MLSAVQEGWDWQRPVSSASESPDATDPRRYALATGTWDQWRRWAPTRTRRRYGSRIRPLPEATPRRGTRDLRRHLLHYPMQHTPETNDILYWRKTSQPATRSERRHISRSLPMHGLWTTPLVSKQIYGTHYFDASLGDHLCARSVRIVARHAPGNLNRAVDISTGCWRLGADDCRHVGTPLVPQTRTISDR
jgi:hypothetical protein